MSQIRCIALEDEAPALEILKNYLSHFEDFQLLESFISPFEAQKYLLNNSIDLIFLDIQLPGLNGLEFLRTLKDPPLVIITSAYSEHGVEAYEQQVFDYLLKPYSLERFSKVLNRVREQGTPDLVSMAKEFILLRVDRQDRKVDLDKIRFVESQKEYVELDLEDEKLLSKIGITELSDQLPDDRFIRVHRSFIVNKDFIKGMASNHVDLGDQQIPIGRLYKKQVQEDWKT